MTTHEQDLEASTTYLRARVSVNPKIAIILGSGLGEFGDLIKGESIAASEIPLYPQSSVPGHAGRIVVGHLVAANRKSRPLLVFQGRVHFYETNEMDKVTYPVEIAERLGVKTLIVTNAAGAISPALVPGDLMFITDFINLTSESPLLGKLTTRNHNAQPAFDSELLDLARSTAAAQNVAFKEGIYCWTKGPSYESAAEIRMMGTLGADAVGMSTVPEVLDACRYGMKVLGISCITNLATGLAKQKLNHVEVTAVANRVKRDFTRLLTEVVLQLV